MDFFGSDEQLVVQEEDPELTRLKKDEKARLLKQEQALAEEKTARSKRLRGARSLMSAGYRGYDDNKLGTA